MLTGDTALLLRLYMHTHTIALPFLYKFNAKTFRSLMMVFATQTEHKLKNDQQFCPQHIHISFFQRAAVAGCCHACGCKQRLVCCQSGLLLKAQILLVFHNAQPLCVPCAESPTALMPSSLLHSDLCCVEGSSSPMSAKQPKLPEANATA